MNSVILLRIKTISIFSACDFCEIFSFLLYILNFNGFKMALQQARRRISTSDMDRGIGMIQSGRSQREVANDLGVSQSVVSRMWNR